jgi:hypothetical protein
MTPFPFNDQLKGIHSLTVILTEAAKYETEHGNAKFVRPARLPLYDKNITDNATTVIRVCAEAAHKSRLDDYASYKVAERGVAKFLRDDVDEIWYNDLKDAETFYTKVTAIEIMALLDTNSGGLHAIDMISLCTNMMQYYVQADGIPQFIVMMENAKKKAKRVGMPIADVELVMMASAAVLVAQHFLREVDDWEGLPAVCRTWRAWKVAFRLAHLKRQRQLQASGGGRTAGWGSLCPTCPSCLHRPHGNSPRQPRSCGGQRHHSPTAAHSSELGAHYLQRHAHCGQQEALGGFG